MSRLYRLELKQNEAWQQSGHMTCAGLLSGFAADFLVAALENSMLSLTIELQASLSSYSRHAL